MGLGLSISKRISEEFGGSATVKSKTGVGSCFLSSMILKPQSQKEQKKKEDIELENLLLVARDKQLNAARYNYEKLIKDSKIEANSDSYVMILDDEAYNCEVLKSILICIGLDPNRIIVCMGGKQALKISKEMIRRQQ